MALWGCATAAAFTLGVAACGGAVAPLASGDGGSHGTSSGSSSGVSSSGSGSSSGGVGSSGGSGSGGVGSSSGGSSSSSGGSGSGGTSGSSSGVSSSSSSGSGSGSSSGVSSSSGSSSGGAGGSVYFEQCNAGALCGSPSFYFSAQFFSGVQPQGCTTTTSGACTYSSCSSTTQSAGDSAGTITISGGSLTSPVPVPFGSNGYLYQTSGTLFTAGQKLTASAAGGLVPAWGPQTVVAPPDALLVAPASGTTVSTSQALGVEWQGAFQGAQFLLQGSSQDSSSYFECEWDASTGKATVPADVMASMASAGPGYIIYSQFAQTTFQAGPYTVSEVAFPFSGFQVTFE
ncbi:MAG TPA: hypothetical protein VIY73_05685 [Polyangiaceae bacterium]